MMDEEFFERLRGRVLNIWRGVVMERFKYIGGLI